MKVTVEATYEITIGDQKFKLTKHELVDLRGQIHNIVGNGQVGPYHPWQFTNPPQEIPEGPIPRSPSIGDDPHAVPSTICSTEGSSKKEPFNPDNDGTSIR